MRLFQGESPIAAEVVVDEALVQDNFIDLTRNWTAAGRSRKTRTRPKIEKVLFETQRDPKTEATFLSHVARTVGSCVGDSVASGDQGVRDAARRETHGKRRQW